MLTYFAKGVALIGEMTQLIDSKYHQAVQDKRSADILVSLVAINKVLLKIEYQLQKLVDRQTPTIISYRVKSPDDWEVIDGD